ncbi:hypothetical protein [Actinospongicola halichondriae]|uniref:hypothetical protein n=1 Tax=Actinospongicola halichondriae TaxID=3236844 RepID=UPI003D589AA8
MGWVPSMAGNVARTDGGLLDLKGRDRSTARTVRTGLAALVVLFVAATLSTSILYPALTPVDEGAHVSYGYYLTTFDPPTVFDPLTGGSYTYRENRTVYTANHPPLYYSLLGPVVRGVNVVADPSTAIHVGRLVSVAFGVMALVSLVGLASELMPKRPSAWLAAGAVGMLLPHVTVNSGFTYNDSAGLAMSLGVLWAGARILTAGPTNRRVLALAILSAAAALTRVSATPFAVVAVGLALAGALRRRGMPDRWRRVAAVVVVPGAVTAVFAGPIYLRNLRLYGDVTGGKALYELLGRHSRPMDGLFESPFMAARYRGLWVDLTFRVDTGPVHMVDRMSFALLWAGLALGVIAIALRTVRWWRGEARHELVVAGALAVVVAVVIWGFVQHVTGGGIAHSRYLLPAWPVYALLVAAGLRWLPHARSLRRPDCGNRQLPRVDRAHRQRRRRCVPHGDGHTEARQPRRRLARGSGHPRSAAWSPVRNDRRRHADRLGRLLVQQSPASPWGTRRVRSGAIVRHRGREHGRPRVRDVIGWFAGPVPCRAVDRATELAR